MTNQHRQFTLGWVCRWLILFGQRLHAPEHAILLLASFPRRTFFARCVHICLCFAVPINCWCFLNRDYIHLNQLPHLPLPSSAARFFAKCLHTCSCWVVPINGLCFLNRGYIHLNQLPSLPLPYSTARFFAKCLHTCLCWVVRINGWCFLNRDYIHLKQLPRLRLPSSAARFGCAMYTRNVADGCL
jgi:hypothetical protein